MEYFESYGVLAYILERIILSRTADQLRSERRIDGPTYVQLKRERGIAVYDGISENLDSQAQCLIVADGIERIDAAAFARWQNLRFVVLPNSLRELGEGAFESCSNLEAVILPKAMRSIGDRCFYGCSKLTYADGVDGIKKHIGAEAFAGCTSLTEVEITAEECGAAMFENCTALVRCRWKCETDVPESAFKNCSTLQSVCFDDIKAIGKEAFDGCTSLTESRNTIFVDGRLPSGEKAGGMIEEVDFLPYYTEYIGCRAFRNCRSLGGVEMPMKLKCLGDEAFAGCTGLSFMIADFSEPEQLVLGERVFDGCRDIVMKFESKPSTKMLEIALQNGYPIELPNRKGKLLPTQAPMNLAQAGAYVLENPYGRFEMNSGVLVRYVGCGGRIELPDGILYIAPGALGAGYGVDGMCWEYIIVGDELMEYQVGDDGFMRVPKGIKRLDRNLGIHGRLKYLVLPEGLESIGNSVFSCEEHLRYIFFPSTLREIGENAFGDCIRLKRVCIPGSVREITEDCFCDCTRLKWVYIGEGTKRIDRYAFMNCKELRHVYLPASLERISRSSFYGCIKLKDILCENKDVLIEKDAFAGCPVNPYRLKRSRK